MRFLIVLSRAPPADSRDIPCGCLRAALSEATKHSHIKFTPSLNQDQQRFTCNIIERVPG